MEECKTKNPTVLPRFSINQEKKGKIKKKIVDLAYILFSCKINRPWADALRPSIYLRIFKARKKKKENIIRKKFAREIQKIIMFLLTVQQNIQIFSFFSAIFRMLRFSKREKSTEKKINERWLKQRLNKQTKKELKITTTTWKKNKQKINILCFDSRRWKALNAADLYKSNLIKNDDLINQKLSVFLLVDYFMSVSSHC